MGERADRWLVQGGGQVEWVAGIWGCVDVGEEAEW